MTNSVESRANHTHLPSVYDRSVFSHDDFLNELDRVHVATEVDRMWMMQAGMPHYDTDLDILSAVNDDKLVSVREGIGFIAISRLYNWDISRSDPSHQWHYSPPFVTPHTGRIIENIASIWQEELGTNRYLSLTSMIRSTEYQKRLAAQERKLTITGDGMQSSHQVGIAFDIDGCGLVEAGDNGDRRSINPRYPGYSPRLIEESRIVLRSILDGLDNNGYINYIEELPGTQENCFHVCVKPETLL